MYETIIYKTIIWGLITMEDYYLGAYYVRDYQLLGWYYDDVEEDDDEDDDADDDDDVDDL